MLAEIKHAGGVIRRPFEAKRRLFVAKFKILLLPAVRAGNMKTHKMRGFTGCTLNLAGASHFGRGATDGLWPDRAFNTFVAKERRRAFLFNILIKGSKFIITRHIHRLFTVVFCRFTAQAPEATTIGKTLHSERVIPVLFAIPRSQRQQRRNIADGRLNVGFHKVLGITIRRQPDKGVALLMLYKVGINTQQHFGITNTGRLHHIHLADVVAAHRIHDGPLKGQCFPAPFLVCGFFREIVIGIRPFNGGLWLRPEQ